MLEDLIVAACNQAVQTTPIHKIKCLQEERIN